MAYILHNSGFDIQSKLYEINLLIDKHIADDSLNSLIIVVPTGKLVFKFKQDIIKKYFAYHNKPSPSPMIFNLKSFVTHCFQNYYRDKQYYIFSDAYRNSIFEEAFSRSELSFFKPNSRIKHSLIDRLANIVYGIKEDGISVADLEQDLIIDEHESGYDQRQIIDKVRLKDIHTIYKSYQELLQKDLFDLTEAINKLNSDFTHEFVINNRFSDSLKSYIFPESAFIQKCNILFWGFSDFKTPEVEFISHFGKSDISTAIHLDFSEKNGPLFGNLSEVTDRLVQSGYSILSFDKEYTQAIHELKPSDFMRKYLFEIENQVPYTKLNNNLAILEFETIEDEVEYILKLVKYLIFVRQIKPTNIAIVCRNPSRYAHSFREGFFLEGIPAHVTDRFELSSSPVVNAIFNVLSVITNGFDKDDVFKMLNNDLLDIKLNDSITESKPDKSSIFFAASELRIRGGLKFGGVRQWLMRLEKAIQFYNSVIDKYDDFHEKRDLETRLNHCKKALNDINLLNNMLRVSKDKFTIGDFVKLIKSDIIDRFSISENISNALLNILAAKNNRDYFDFITIKEQTEKNGKALKTFLELLDEIHYVMNSRNPSQLYGLKELFERLKTAVKSEKYQILDKMNYGVNITSIEQIRGIDYQVGILCGVNDGDFPLPYRAEALLGKKLPDSENRHDNAERIQFYQFLTNAHELLDNYKKLIFLSYICNDESGELVKSPFLTYLCKITGLDPIRPETVVATDNHDSLQSIIQSPLSYLANDNELYENRFRVNFESDTNHNHNVRAKTLSNLDYIDKFNLTNQSVWSYDKDDIIELENDGKLRKNIFSASEIEQYVKCPYQYYVSKQLKTEKIEQKDPSLTPLELGSIMHNILYYFYVSIQQDPNSTGSWVVANPKFESLPELKPVHLDSIYRENYKKILFEIAEMILNKYAISSEMFKFERDQLLGLNSEGIYKKGILETWLDNEINKDAEYSKFKPVLFEFAFGMNDGTPAIEIHSVNGSIKIRGKIDRVELFLNEESDCFNFRIADYKTNISNDHKIAGVKNFRNFQTPLYTKAAEQILNDLYRLRAKSDSALYYRLNLPESDKDKFLSEVTDKDFEELLNQSTSKAIEIAENIRNFIFPVKPVNADICNFCNYETLCRIKSRDVRNDEIDEDSQS